MQSIVCNRVHYRRSVKRMTVLETAGTVQDQILEAIKVGEEAVLSAVKSFTEAVEPVTSRLPEAPFAAKLTDPTEVIDQAFGFAGKLLSAQKEFAVELTKALYPAGPASP